MKNFPIIRHLSFLERLFPVLFLAFLFLSISSPVYAHHPWEGLAPDSYNSFQGFISGLAHPIIGFDHFLFLLSIGLVRVSSKLRWIPSLLSCGMIGSIFAQISPSLYGSEILIGISLIASAFVALGYLQIFWMLPLITLHGYVLGQSMIGAEPTPLISYILGLLLSQLLALLFGIEVLRKFSSQKKFIAIVLIGFGLAFTIGTLISAV